MTEATSRSHKPPLRTAACLAMALAIAIAAVTGSAYAGGDSGGKGDGGGKDEGHPEKKLTSQGHKAFDAKNFIDRFDGNHPPKDPGGGNGSGGDGSGSGGGKLGS